MRETQPTTRRLAFCPTVQRVTRERRETRSAQVVDDEMDLQSVSCTGPGSVGGYPCTTDPAMFTLAADLTA